MTKKKDMSFEDQLDPGYIQMSMWDQLGRIEDSADAMEAADPGKFNLINTVVTDDDWEYKVTPSEAVRLKQVILMYPTQSRRKLFEEIQVSSGFELMLKTVKILEEKGK